MDEFFPLVFNRYLVRRSQSDFAVGIGSFRRWFQTISCRNCLKPSLKWVHKRVLSCRNCLKPSLKWVHTFNEIGLAPSYQISIVNQRKKRIHEQFIKISFFKVATSFFLFWVILKRKHSMTLYRRMLHFDVN